MACLELWLYSGSEPIPTTSESKRVFMSEVSDILQDYQLKKYQVWGKGSVYLQTTYVGSEECG